MNIDEYNPGFVLDSSLLQVTTLPQAEWMNGSSSGLMQPQEHCPSAPLAQRSSLWVSWAEQKTARGIVPG